MRYKKEFSQKHGASRNSGLSLVELMVSLALSATLILGIFTVYMDSSQTARLSTSLARIQESARIGVDIMARDLRMVGFQGCADLDDVTLNVIADNPPTTDFFETTLRGWEVTGANWADGTEFDGTAIESGAVIGSDVVAIQRGENVNVQITGNMNATNANIQVGGPEVNLFAQNDIVLISDCESADLFRISSNPSSNTWAHANNVNSSNRLSQAYNQQARIMRFSAAVYYVADTGRDDNQGNDIFALYRAINNLNNGAPTFQVDELVEGVESLQIQYGERLPSNNFRYTSADNASLDMTRVVAIKVGLLVSDAERVRDNLDTTTYDLPGEAIVSASGGGTVTHPVDSRLRRSFVKTVALRNRD